MKMTDLKIGDRFILNNRVFEYRGVIKKWMPTLGRVYNMKAIEVSTNEEQLFLNDVEVQEVKQCLKMQ
jgi:hypothetical protein